MTGTAARTGISEATPTERPRLLITEDNAALRQMLSWEFEELGYRVFAVGSCREALHAAISQQPQLALLDFNLPDGNGTLLLQALQRRLPGLPVVLYSGKASGATAAEARRCGACHFVCKPVSADRLHAIFSELLS